ncbi:two-component sensor histidine kinase [Nostoc sp. NIES-3756]|uniref:sensor histidine kinase n=1 Tax=Nostoc sp. NIES-3756 TaxID=1751286 RepID=UPI000721F3D6|nr:ATP-binding protein [Nostoc sp. NIES-3756]BAT52466.1 two-component sensor histidine kinase [Nostoc sp. NIES-3756]
MLEFINEFFTDSLFIPHGHCYLWKPGLVWLNILSDSLIALAYYSIPISLMYFVHKRKDLPFKGIMLLFGAFIVSCGTTHLMEIWTLWHPTYWLSGSLKAITALISVYTASVLVPIIPQALALPSPTQLEASNAELKAALQNLENTQSQLIQTEKLSSMGQLVSGIAYEINNPINFIYGNIHFAKEYVENLLVLLALYKEHYPHPPSTIQAYIQEVDINFLQEDLEKILSSIKIGAGRIRELILSLRKFSRLDEAEIKKVDIHQSIDSTLLLLQNRLKKQERYPEIEIVKEYGNLPKISCYPKQLNQVFMNILTNAVDALEESLVNQEKIKESGSIGLTKPKIYIHTEILNNEQVRVRIADNGYGMVEEVRQKVFDPFFTTKPITSGTGLGLSISRQIIDKHGGQIECISSPLKGTEFIIQLPIQITFCKINILQTLP